LAHAQGRDNKKPQGRHLWRTPGALFSGKVTRKRGRKSVVLTQGRGKSGQVSGTRALEGRSLVAGRFTRRVERGGGELVHNRNGPPREGLVASRPARRSGGPLMMLGPGPLQFIAGGRESVLPRQLPRRLLAVGSHVRIVEQLAQQPGESRPPKLRRRQGS